MSGIYILTAPFLDDNNTIKIGLSKNFSGRLKSYTDIFTGAFFRYTYEINGTMEDISEIENVVLYKTRDLRNEKLNTEFRFINDVNDLQYYNNLIIDEITSKGLSYTCKENKTCPNKRSRDRFSERAIKLDVTNNAVNTCQIDNAKKRLAGKLNLIELSNELFGRIKDKEHIIDNIICYMTKKANKRIDFINQFVEVYGFKDLFDFQTKIDKDDTLEQRMKSSGLLEWDTYVKLMKCFCKRITKSKHDVPFNCCSFVILSGAIFSEFGVELVSDRCKKRKGCDTVWFYKYYLKWDKTEIGKLILKK